MDTRHLQRETREELKRSLKLTGECLAGGGHTTRDHNPDCFYCHPSRMQDLMDRIKAELGVRVKRFDYIV